MKVRRILPLFFSLVLGLVAGDTKALAITLKPGDPGVYQWSGFLYTLVDGPTWKEADQNARMISGGNLTSIHSQEENDFLYSTFSQLVTGAWIGLTDEITEGVYVWTDSNQLVYSNWGPGDPSNSPTSPTGEDYVSMGLNPLAPGIWGDSNNEGFGNSPDNAGLKGIAKVAYQTPDVPGPLPVFGAAAAFGFSRKLRNRISSSQGDH